MSVTIDEIREMIDWISEFGKDEAGGVTRLLYTESWLNVQNTLKEKFRQLGMEAGFDAIGNLQGKLAGTEAGAGTISTGSHVDTVVNGGKLDGQLGIIGGYLAIKDLLETYGRPKKNLAVLSIAEEEGSRFTDAMHQCGFDFAEEENTLLKDTEKFVELHIEQGNTLEMEGRSVGIIHGIMGQKRYNITLKGEANHAGTTLMKYRHDVVQVYAKIVTEAVAMAKEVEDGLLGKTGTVIHG